MKTQFLGGKLKGTPKSSLFIIKYFQKLENICTYFKFSQKLMKKLKENLEKTQAKIPKKPQKQATPVELTWRKIVQTKSLYSNDCTKRNLHLCPRFLLKKHVFSSVQIKCYILLDTK